MLVLTRKPGEKVVIGNGITVTVVQIQGNRVRLVFDAPEEVHILRGELACWLDDPARCAEPAEAMALCGE